MYTAEDPHNRDDDDDEPKGFPRLDGRAPPRLPGRDEAPSGAAGAGREEVLLQVHQRRGRGSAGFEVHLSPDGAPEIPMAVSATTVGSWLPREVLARSPWLARCLAAPEGAVLTRSLQGDGDEEELLFEEGALDDGRGVTCRKASAEVLELGLPLRGAGRRLLPSGGVLQCLELAAPDTALDPSMLSTTVLLGVFLWAVVLELAALAAACREALAATVDATTVALQLAAAHATADEELLRRCYWCLREAMCGATGVPSAWLDGRGPVKLLRGRLAYGDICSTPLQVLSGVVQEDMDAKQERWHRPMDCYTLCQVHRQRQPSGAYPHVYEVRLDHSDEVVMRAFREDEQSSCRIFSRKVTDASMASEHSEDYLGAVVPNFWGTVFTLYDSGTDVDALSRRCREAAQIPLRQRGALCSIGYETNLLGDCPRRVTVDFERGGARHHMENVAPRWDKKLNSYALPFFGRVKKASAKNFQLVVNNDANTIFLMFGKISKDVFCLDYRGPIAPLDAMAIAIAALAKKRAVS